ncbi:MAG: MoxR family ATPase [Verrucomicrobia bacterium]|nr:MoxR family ATPase [Verrucomicrobiota bacterium]
MDAVFNCPKCGQELAVDESWAGSEVPCPTCGVKVTVPSNVNPPNLHPAVTTTAATPAATGEDEQLARHLCDSFKKATTEIAKLIVGQDDVIEQIVIAIFARSHCLLEGVPGLAKTFMIRSLADVMQLSFRRVQFTPDLMPADITGTDIIQEDPKTGRRQLSFMKGPIFAQMILADEINRSPPKTQAALLEAMQEHSVTVGGETYRLEEPFFVLATQNPLEQEGTYPLPEAQKDRFMFHVKVDYPTREQERLVVERTTSAYHAKLEPVLSGHDILRCQEIVRRVPVPDHVMDFVLDLVRRSRPNEATALPFVKELVAWGPGPRACQQLVLGGKVRAILRGRFHVTTDDIEALAYPVLRHRIVATFNAEADGISVDEIIRRLLAEVPRGEAEKVM